MLQTFLVSARVASKATASWLMSHWRHGSQVRSLNPLAFTGYPNNCLIINCLNNWTHCSVIAFRTKMYRRWLANPEWMRWRIHSDDNRLKNTFMWSICCFEYAGCFYFVLVSGCQVKSKKTTAVTCSTNQRWDHTNLCREGGRIANLWKDFTSLRRRISKTGKKGFVQTLVSKSIVIICRLSTGCDLFSIAIFWIILLILLH